MSGVAALSTHLAVMSVLIEYLHVSPMIATGIGFILACMVNFYIQSIYVFKTKDKKWVRALRYLAVTCVTLILNNLLFYALLTTTELHYSIVQIATTGFIFILNYVLNLIWTFNKIATTTQSKP